MSERQMSPVIAAFLPALTETGGVEGMTGTTGVSPSYALALVPEIIVSERLTRSLLETAVHPYLEGDQRRNPDAIRREVEKLKGRIYRNSKTGAPVVFPLEWTVSMHGTDPMPYAMVRVDIDGASVEVKVVPLFTLGLNEDPKEGNPMIVKSGGAWKCTGRFDAILIRSTRPNHPWRALLVGLASKSCLAEFNKLQHQNNRPIIPALKHRLNQLGGRPRMAFTPTMFEDHAGRSETIGYWYGKRVTTVPGSQRQAGTFFTTKKSKRAGKTFDEIDTFLPSVWEYVERETDILVTWIGHEGEVSLVPNVDVAELRTLRAGDVNLYEAVGRSISEIDPTKVRELFRYLRQTAQIPTHPTRAYGISLGVIKLDDDVRAVELQVLAILDQVQPMIEEEVELAWRLATQRIDQYGLNFTDREDVRIDLTLDLILQGIEVREGRNPVEKFLGRRAGEDPVTQFLTERMRTEFEWKPFFIQLRAFVVRKLVQMKAELERSAAPAPEAVEDADANPPGDAAAPGDSADTSTSPPSGEDGTTQAS